MLLDICFKSKYYIIEKIYYPYPTKDGIHKYYSITKSGKEVYFRAVGYSDLTIHAGDERKKRYIERHKNREN